MSFDNIVLKQRRPMVKKSNPAFDSSNSSPDSFENEVQIQGDGSTTRFTNTIS